MKDLHTSTQKNNTDVDAESASVLDKLERVHPMKQITYASIIQISMFGFMLLMFWTIGQFV